MIIPVRFSNAALRGSVYYTQYLRRLFATSGDVCSGQSDINPSSYTAGNACPVGNCTHPAVAGGSTTRAIDLSKPTAPNNDPFSGAGGCPVCHSVSAQGNVYVAGSKFLQTNGTPTGTSTGFVTSIGLNGAGSPTFTTLGEAPNYATLPGATDWDSRGFAFAALTPDGAYALQGPYWWGNTQDGALASSTTDASFKVNSKTRPMFVVPDHQHWHMGPLRDERGAQSGQLRAGGQHADGGQQRHAGGDRRRDRHGRRFDPGQERGDPE